MMGYVAPLFAIVLLCGCWALFQVWLARQDPELHSRSLKCGNCNCDDECEKAAPEGAADSRSSFLSR